MMKPIIYQKDTAAWIFQVWVSFLISVGATTFTVIAIPAENNWMKGCFAIGYLYSLSSAFTLAKTIRDNLEASRLTARIDEAMVEKILAENHPLRN
ncbi:MAG: YiaA/YiaB family inner membrane protein [Pseudanabaenaceae cyanobacterium SKYGB_i_bin29]|nr:YiaA/YiaB family inner membrane protein [Pseudanabaenaceae cyanobacterium SKYG29]MDW8421629.1 YiaA/YiaB family inner membrane protein [Pseudanabaenaceae cyanobacterium SKYGB_i_bin29]